MNIPIDILTAPPKSMTEVELTIEETAKGYGHKVWTNPAGTQHRMYLHRFEGKHKKDCGHIDLLTKEYHSPKKSNRKGDDIEYTIDGDGEAVFQMTIAEESVSITKLTSSPVTVASNQKSVLDAGEPQKILEHLALVNATASSITVSYGNTVEVKSKNRYGNIQTQYPKLSMQIELTGGNTVGNLEQVADNVVEMVEKKLTEIINELTS